MIGDNVEEQWQMPEGYQGAREIACERWRNNQKDQVALKDNMADNARALTSSQAQLSTRSLGLARNRSRHRNTPQNSVLICRHKVKQKSKANLGNVL